MSEIADLWTPERVYNLAEAHDGRYLISAHEYRDKGAEFLACDALVADGCARWDRNSNLWPVIKLTGNPHHPKPLTKPSPLDRESS